ncbi:3-carboxy-cis,cis-muconate cycloisomerase [Streptosporangiaceae bacterium NEAU-GS5]|nr:3-carboxy-cis,cis-muconate cycloisomerase [Streptosporangiaceae bacterium NEAU-GS5]
MIDAEVALARAQADLGMIPATAAGAIEGLRSSVGPADLAERAREGGNPVIPLVKAMTEAAGPAAGPYVHLGATSQDILDTALMLVAHRTLGPILDDLAVSARALGRLAAEHRATPMPGRTLTQHAVPTTFGLKAAGWRSLIIDARARLDRVRRSLPVQLGGAAGTLSAVEAYGGDLRLLGAYARQTGLAEPTLPWHVLRTPIADLGAALGFAAGALGKAAADVLVLSRTEIGEVGEPTGGGSSALPHKNNPVRATLIAAAARQVPALTAVLLGALAAEDERPGGAWHAEWQPLRESLRLVGGAAQAAAELMTGLRVHPDRMRANLGLTGGLIVSERLVAELTPLIGRAAARRLLDEASREGVPLAEAIAGRTPLEEGRLAEIMDPARYLGLAPALVDRALADEEDP